MLSAWSLATLTNASCTSHAPEAESARKTASMIARLAPVK